MCKSANMGRRRESRGFINKNGEFSIIFLFIQLMKKPLTYLMDNDALGLQRSDKNLHHLHLFCFT